MTTIVLISLLGILSLFLGLYKADKYLLPVNVAGLLLGLFLTVQGWNKDLFFYSEMMRFDNYALAFSSLCIISTLLILVLSKGYFERISQHSAEYHAIILFALCGALCMVAYQNLAMLFIGIEILSVSLYVLAGIRKKDTFSNEASLKYFLMGAFATGFLLFGIALVYGATGSFNIQTIGQMASNPANTSILYAGIAMLLIGLAFKVSAAPFHFWSPDVYEGSPALITAFMATVVKTAGFAAMLRLFSTCFVSVAEFWTPILTAICMLTLFVGNVTAVYQQNVKRMLAYSSISHAGYMLLALIALGATSSSAIFIYTLGYSLATIAAFSVLIAVKQQKGAEDVSSFNGLAKTNPLMAAIMALAMLSLAGIPLTAGFYGKFFLFSTALSKGFIAPVIVAVINAAIGIYYYFKLIIAMYFKEGDSNEVPFSTNYKWVAVLTASLVLILGIVPQLISGIL